MPKKILLVEDDESLGFVTKDSLESRGYQVKLSVDGEAALSLFDAQHFDICLLDIMLPKLDGFSLAAQIRAKDKNIPIIFLTAKSLQKDKLAGFELGGDDYITKPFSLDELVFRIEVFLKRKSNEGHPTVNQTIGSYTLNLNNHALEKGEEIKKLTRREAEILNFLLERKGELVKREDILLALWGDDDYFKGRSLDVFISKLRKYLKSDPTVDIENFHGVGFKLRIEH